jgi:endonuclease/exonuclease/phosphatase family metal-dependent hydrolase
VLHSIEKTSEYQKWCFDMIAPTVEENRALKEDIVCLQEMLQQTRNKRDALQATVDGQHRHLDQERKGIWQNFCALFSS